MLGKFRSIFIVLVFEFIGNISYLSKYTLWLKKVVLLLVLSYIVQLVRAMVTLVFDEFSSSVICQVVQKILKTLSCSLLKGK